MAELIGERIAGTPDDNSDGLARTESLQACLDRLSPAHRRMIIERYAEGYSVEECARRHRRSAAGLRVTLHRLRLLLRRCLSQSSSSTEK
ncbi:MAG TPA: sigma factor-like helix-turn-helix DNA-binding protein [Luteolibacter sp.]|nr:sigma factor-like helix-turn-helix DNA-binding protein [Luteolibacter sp.]